LDSHFPFQLQKKPAGQLPHELPVLSNPHSLSPQPEGWDAQSPPQFVAFSPASHTPLPQIAPLPQSAGQPTDSPCSQMPFPHLVPPPQSDGQVAADSPPSHFPLPQIGLVPPPPHFMGFMPDGSAVPPVAQS
jgi:hypothetical protein